MYAGWHKVCLCWKEQKLFVFVLTWLCMCVFNVFHVCICPVSGCICVYVSALFTHVRHTVRMTSYAHLWKGLITLCFYFLSTHLKSLCFVILETLYTYDWLLFTSVKLHCSHTSRCNSDQYMSEHIACIHLSTLCVYVWAHWICLSTLFMYVWAQCICLFTLCIHVLASRCWVLQFVCLFEFGVIVLVPVCESMCQVYGILYSRCRIWVPLEFV